MSGSEADRLIKLIRKNDTPNLAALVQVGGDYPLFLHSVTRISTECPSTFVILAAFTDNTVMLATIVPPGDRVGLVDDWFAAASNSLIFDPMWKNDAHSPDGSGYIAAVWGVLGFQQSPEKFADQVLGIGTHFLKQSGWLPAEEEEEKEYTFDDLYSKRSTSQVGKSCRRLH